MLCTGVNSNALGEDNKFGIHMDCADASTIFHRIQINQGVMTEKAVANAPVSVISIPVTRNQKAYSGCLEMTGKNPKLAKMAFFQDLDRCRLQASSKPLVSISAKNDPVLGSSFDAKEFEQCMHGKDRKLEVELIRH
ncbi:MAG: hypothetical protein ACRERV_05080 [Methylococcales bacterium]